MVEPQCNEISLPLPGLSDCGDMNKGDRDHDSRSRDYLDPGDPDQGLIGALVMWDMAIKNR